MKEYQFSSPRMAIKQRIPLYMWVVKTHYRQKIWNIWRAQWKHSLRTFWFAGNGLAPTTSKYCYFNATLTGDVMDENCNLQYPKLKLYNTIYRNMPYFDTWLKMTHNFQNIHHCIAHVWEFCMHSMIRYWHHAQCGIGRQISIWALKQNGRTVWLKVSYFVIWYHMENLLHLYKPCLLKLGEAWS